MAAGEGDIIKSFLVGLGFDVDEASLRVFNEQIAKSAARIISLYTAVNAFAGAIVYAFSKISEGFEEMGYQYHIIAPAINKAIVLRHELMKAYGAAGINIRKVIVDSVKLNMSLTKTKYAMEAIYKSVASRFFTLLTKQSDAFRKRLYDNMPYIISALEKLVKTVFKAFEAVTILGGRLWSILSRVYDFFVMLDKATDGWSTVILGLVAAWRLLNLSFVATPLGLLLTGFVSLLALFDDFKTFQEGGKSFFDWGPAIPIIEGISKVIWDLCKAMQTLAFLVGDVFSLDRLTGWRRAKELLNDILTLSKDAINLIFTGETNGLSKYRGVTGNGNVFPSSPLGSQPAIAPFNMNANMQTSINITGSPNADATARATAQQQQTVNRDFVRNMKGATR